MQKNIYIIANTGWFNYIFNYNLIKSLSEEYIVTIISENDNYINRIIGNINNVSHRPIVLNHKGTNPIFDFILFFQFFNMLRHDRPNIILNFTIKPNIYATYAAKLLNIPTINQITGLGTVFLNNKLYSRIGRFLYRNSQKYATKVIFQNEEDFNCFTKNKINFKDVCFLPGPGVDTVKFHPSKKNQIFNHEFTFTFIGRILRDKGIIEFIQASKMLLKEFPNININIIGQLNSINKSSLSEKEFDEYISNSTIKYLGMIDNVVDILSNTDCMVLPSYREGTGKVLLEAAAMEIPLIASDTAGCNKIIIDNINGFLCKVGDSSDLYSKMLKMLNLSNEERATFGINSRKHILINYDEKIIIAKYQNYIRSLIN